jgi:hypothetical protein
MDLSRSDATDLAESKPEAKWLLVRICPLQQ